VLVEEFLREDKLERGTESFFNYSKNRFKEGRVKTTGKFSFAFVLFRFLNSNVKRDCFSQAITKNSSIFLHDLERVNEFFRFLFHNFKDNNILNHYDKTLQKSMATFLANEINTTDRNITGKITHVQIMFPLKHKKCRVFENIFCGTQMMKQSKKVKLCERLH